MKRLSLLPLLLIVAVITATGCATSKPEIAPPPPALTPEKMEELWKKASTPKEEHAFLKNFEGTWKAKAKMWFAPDAKPEVSSATATNTFVFGGKFLKETYNGSFMKRPYQGFGYLGFDNVKGEFTSFWIDSMSTAMMFHTGSYDPSAKTLTFNGNVSCPMSETGKQSMRSVFRSIDKKHFIFEMYNISPDGKEFKSLEILYSK